MLAEVKNYYSDEFHLETYWPEDIDSFGFWLTAEIGLRNKPGGDRFEFLVCSPNWLNTEYQKDKIVFGRHMIIASEFDLAKVYSKIEKYVSTCHGDTWIELASEIAKIGLWEFENFQV